MDQLGPAGGGGFLTEAHDQAAVDLVREIVQALTDADDGADLKAPDTLAYRIRRLLSTGVVIVHVTSCQTVLADGGYQPPASR